jgi:ribosomal protein L11 methyltransferase
MWTELCLRVRSDAAEQAASVLEDLSGCGTVIEPPIEVFGPDEGYELDREAPQTVKAYFYGSVSPQQRAAIRRRLKQSLESHALEGRLIWRTLREEDWANTWKQHYSVQHVGSVVIRPVWLDYAARPGETVISLDPGMAFGTGDHPTTRMCLLAMQRFDLKGASVLDLGTGSGILALAAVALGAAHCLALDIEAMAVTAARINIDLNGAADRIHTEQRSLDPQTDGPFDAVFANIHASAIIGLAADLARVAKSGARLLAGGVIAPRLAEALHALKREGWSIQDMLSEGDWRTIVARRA